MEQGLLLPEFGKGLERADIVNVASVPQRSPFRYPGGKTWLVPLFRNWLRSLSTGGLVLIEPFAGGATISLTTVAEKLAERAVMVELDEQIAAVWQTILGADREWLIRRITEFDLTLESATSELNRIPKSIAEMAFQTILKNRTFHCGILAPGSTFLKHGENGKGIRSRWYPQTLAKRIRNIGLIADRLEFIRGDAFDVLKRFERNAKAIFFIDPPYTAGGKRAGNRLYTYYDLDHEQLFSMCENLAGDFLMTYDNAEEVKNLARRHGFEFKPVSMKNTHHENMTELLIGRNLSWV